MKKPYFILKQRFALIFMCMFFLGSISVFAQLTLPNDDGNVSDVPIDGFIITGLITGAAIGIRSYLKDKKER